jgi:hypothetical protein
MYNSPSMNTTGSRHPALYVLALFGFIALVGAGMWLAIYSTRFVPTVVNGLGAAAVYLGSVFKPSNAALTVVPSPTASSTPVTTEASSTPIATAGGDNTSTTGGTSTVKPAPGKETTSTVQIGGSTGTPVLSGLPDLAVTITAVGYLTSTSPDSFVATTTVPVGGRPAVKFTIKNIGTNVTGAWRFSASIPTQTAFIYQSQLQQALGPGDSIDYTLGFDQANKGVNQTVSVTANFDKAVTESNSNNDSASATLTILGS